jgi:hypothetical protein
MPIQFTVDPAARLVVYVVKGYATRTEAHEFFDTLLSHPDFQRGFSFLGDRRESYQGQSSSYILAVADELELRRRALAPCRWAIIVDDERSYALIRMWGLLTDRTGVEILPVWTAEEAADWLCLPEAISPRELFAAA